jgi:hypothetical protein
MRCIRSIENNNNFKNYATANVLEATTFQKGGNTALWEMASSTPSWRPPHLWGEFDGFPGRRQRPNQNHKMIVSGFSSINISNPQKKSQKKKGTI